MGHCWYDWLSSTIVVIWTQRWLLVACWQEGADCLLRLTWHKLLVKDDAAAALTWITFVDREELALSLSFVDRRLLRFGFGLMLICQNRGGNIFKWTLEFIDYAHTALLNCTWPEAKSWFLLFFWLVAELVAEACLVNFGSSRSSHS